MYPSSCLKVVVGLSFAFAQIHSFGQIVFTDDFDTDHTANWTVNAAAGTHPVNIFFDYSTVGIPSAPNSVGLTTRGLKLQGNTTGNVFGGVSVSPTGQSFLGDYTIRFDMWMNYQGAASPGAGINTGGNGTTQGAGVGLGTAGTTPQWAGGVHDSLHFSMTGDGGSAQDYRVYPVGALAAPASGFYAAGTTTTGTDVRNDTHSYYGSLGTRTAPAAQVALFPALQTGTTRPGAAGFAWRDVIVTKNGNTVTWTIDGLLIATVNTGSLTFGGDNILFDYYDTNSSSSTDPDAATLLFGLIDNVRVTQIPEPTTCALALVGGAFLLTLRRRK